MSFLRILRFGFVFAWRFGQVVRSELFGDKLTDLVQGIVRQTDRIGAHVGYQSNLAGADVDTFVQSLRGAHGALRAEAELARRFLLQGRGRKWRRRVTLALFLFDFVSSLFDFFFFLMTPNLPV